MGVCLNTISGEAFRSYNHFKEYNGHMEKTWYNLGYSGNRMGTWRYNGDSGEGYNEWIAGAWEYRQFGYNGHRTTYSMTRRGNAQVITQVAVHF